jgi:hypothetical protein
MLIPLVYGAEYPLWPPKKRYTDARSVRVFKVFNTN